MLGNKEVIENLKTVGFDMIIGDMVPLYHVILSQVLNVPCIHYSVLSMVPSQHDRFAFNPSYSAYMPERLSSLTDVMTFRERTTNALLYLITGYFYYHYMLTPMDDVLRKRNIRPDANFGQLLSEAAMWIFNSDFVFDFPRPFSPHVKFVGGVLTGPSKPLDEEWQSFVDGAGEHGIVIMTLGTLISDELTDQQAESIASSLALLSQKVAWSYSGKLPKTLVSAMARDRASPMTGLEEVAYWVEYAVRHGTDHLKPRAMQLSFVQYYLLDVIAIIVVMVTIMCFCVARACAVFRRNMFWSN
ncbi:UDP-glucuronosyltransferase 1-2-like [Acanthaster planci]|uniref:UDP-glucuronosyltransferase 1-2-like n=1 Tax=Acanthaster planci TaxID=133434 RepID=A0A8B7Z1I0_ACAPL|nr:UDP-glucuronosyltransferase 1-2-like [Acanthaster planci]